MNNLYIDQIIQYINNSRLENKNYYDDKTIATGALEWVVAYLEKKLERCHGVFDGKCQFYWKHEDCVRLMNILYDLTGSDRYINKRMGSSSWD